jgi:hypothetical protein
MSYTAEMGLGVVIYIPSFIKISELIQRLMERGLHTHTHRRYVNS